MLRQIPSEKIKEWKLAELGVEPMIWTYIKDIYRFIPYSQWITFSELFPHVWSASAFKGYQSFALVLIIIIHLQYR